MSDISPLEPMSDFAPNRFETKREEIEPPKSEPREESQTPVVHSAAEQQDQKKTLNAFQYTGKGSFIDKIF